MARFIRNLGVATTTLLSVGGIPRSMYHVAAIMIVSWLLAAAASVNNQPDRLPFGVHDLQ